ncbi:class I SAM-dependent methyltransferase [Nostoc sp. UHCC 0870]|uniref:class I SAM-dependent methyltransferase n=1 Tax=Nostoc sp. UHCC 0870 TaxID=2914041 RepID=UPI001EDCA685|nr:class I SAM-dependent methyltransferase [Nostoc sp. UHCC 0870]UKO99560.1 amino acid adenylation domain-containing protein [Nostoc sp. UHCC 0870]
MSLFSINSQDKVTAVDFDPFAAGELLLTAPATESQKEIWASVQMGDAANCAYNESQSLQLKGQLNLACFQSALQQLIEYHEALRTTLSTDGNTLCIVSRLTIDIPIIDLSALELSERDIKLAKLLKQEVEQPFDLEHGPLFRAKIIKLHPDQHLVTLTAHHIICDGWSWGVLMPELAQIYSALVQGLTPDLETPDIFSQYANLQEEEEQTSEAIATEQYWLDQFSDSVPLVDFPTDRQRPPLRTFNSAREDWQFSAELVTSLKQLGTQFGCSFMTTILTGFEVWLHRLTGQNDLVVGIPAAGQAASGQYNLVGHCVNLLPLRTQINSEISFSDYLQTRRSVVLDAYDHQQFTFGSLVKKLVLTRDSSRIPLVPIIFNIDQGLDTKKLPFAGLEVDFYTNPRSFENFEIYLNATELGGKLFLECQYNTNLFDAATVRRRLAELETLLQGIVANPHQTIAKLPLLPQDEQNLLAAWNNTTANYPEHLCIHQLFEAQVEKTPEAIAVIFEDQQLTYQELNQRTNQLAHHLQSLGVGPEVLVGLCVERCLEMVVGVLAILKAGGAYLPLDYTYPQDRLTFMLQDAQIPVLLTQEHLTNSLPQHQAQIIYLDGDKQSAQAQLPNPSSNVTPDNLAYLIYTSGSTGQPKGVQIEHQNAVNLLHSIQQTPGLTAQDTLLSVTSLSFDIAVSEIFLPLSVGAKLVLASRAAAADGNQLLKLLTTHNVTFMQPTPITWRLLLAAGWQGSPQLKMISTGEALPRELANQLLPQGAALWNLYGPTETTIWATGCQVTTGDKPISIGRPVANTQTYILDSHLQPVPIGIPGELYIGGSGLARGYLNRPDLTTERFIPNPLSADIQSRLYKTGDLVRYLPNGEIEYLGRIDYQVKVRGFRIELGEIEAVMAQHPAVKEAVVVVREDIPEDKTLVGYLVAKQASDIDLSGNATISNQHVQDWNQRWDLLYQSALDNTSAEALQNQTLSDVAIIKQFTNQDGFEQQAQEWLDQTVERILALKPSRVMEIGCGTGQILLEVAPQCTYYMGTDYAAPAIQALRQQVETTQKNLPEVVLDHRPADDFGGIEANAFDTVIIHSVVQYFPNADYLLQVIEKAVAAVKTGGWIYIGDVQSYGLLETYHTMDQLKRSPASMPINTLKGVVENRVRNEDELVVDPGFFYALKQKIPAIAHIDCQLRQGSLWNETTQFHYDVFLYIGTLENLNSAPTWHDWLDEQLTLTEVRRVLEATQPEYYCLSSIPNARIQKEVQALALLKQDQTLATVGDLQAKLETVSPGIDPEYLWNLGKDLSYKVDIRWSDTAKDGYMEAVFSRLDQKSAQAINIVSPLSQQKDLLSWAAYANSPMLKQADNEQLIPELRQFLKEQLPEYMVPATFMILESMPLTPNGKVDRKALPKPDRVRLALEGNYVAPSTPAEQQIADIWSQVLRLERVGIYNNFFELGGHSLLGTQVMARLYQTFQVKLPLSTLFEVPTIADLTKRVEVIRMTTATWQPPQSDLAENYEEGEI